MVSGTTRSASLASIITARCAPVRAPRNSVWPGKRKPALHQDRLVDRRGDQGRRFAGKTGLDGGFDGLDHGGIIGGIGLAWDSPYLGFRGDRHAGHMRQTRLGIADQLQGMVADPPAQLIEGGADDFRPDAGRFPHRDEEWANVTGPRHRRRVSSRAYSAAPWRRSAPGRAGSRHPRASACCRRSGP